MSTTNATAPTTPNLSISRTRTSTAPRSAVEQGGVCTGATALRVGPAAVSARPAHRYPRRRDVAATRPRRIPRRRHHRRWPAGPDVRSHPPSGWRSPSRVLAEAPDAVGRPGRPVRAGRRPHRRRGGARLRPRLRRRDLRPRARAGRRARARWRPTASRCTPARPRCVFAQDKLAMRRRLTEIGVAVPARGRRSATAADVAGLRRRGRLAGGGQDPPRRLRRQGRARHRVRRRGRGLAGGRGPDAAAGRACSPTACSPRSGSTSSASWRCWSPAAPPGRRGVAGRRDRADRRHLHRGARPGARPRRRPRRAGDRGGAAHRRRAWASPGCMAVELFEVRDPRTGRAGIRRQRAGHAPAQQRALDASTARSPASSSSTCVPCSTCRWATRGRASRGRSWPTCSAATTPSCTRRTGTCWRATRG